MTAGGGEAMEALAQLNRRVDALRAFEREYRARLRVWVEEGEALLDGGDGMLPLRAAARRLAGASDGDLRVVLRELPEPARQRITATLLRIPVPEVTS